MLDCDEPTDKENCEEDGEFVGTVAKDVDGHDARDEMLAAAVGLPQQDVVRRLLRCQ